MKIVSLLPSATELVCGLGLRDHLVGVSHECDYPLSDRNKTKVFLVDGNAYFSRPGPRLVDGLEIMAHTLHPEIHSLPEGLPSAIQFNT